MTIWQPEIAQRSGPRYQAIADAISDAISDGALRAGDRLPPQRDLAWRLGVTVGTVSRAYALAEQKGLLSGEVGRGTFVRDPGVENRSRLLPLVSDVACDLGINMVCSAAHAVALREAMGAIAERDGLENLMPYMPLGGHPEHRAYAARWIARRGLSLSPDRVVATCGAQHGLAVALSVVANPGASVLGEALTYAGVVDTARFVGRSIEPVAIDDEGMVPEALDRAARNSNARAVVVVPTIHNPTACMMGEARRAAIVEVARRHDLIIVEDDVYGLLPEDAPTPIAAMAPERTFYLTSASKTLAPGLRIGWVVPPPEHVQSVADAVFASTVAQPAVTHEILRHWIENGTADALLDEVRTEMSARQVIARETLTGAVVRGHPSSFHCFVDLPDHWSAGNFVDAAMAKGIRITAASMFAVGTTPAPNAVRISVASARDRETLRTALATLNDLFLRGHYGPSRGVV